MQVFEGETQNNQIGEIIKHWGGCREIFGGVNDFRLKSKSVITSTCKLVSLLLPVSLSVWVHLLADISILFCKSYQFVISILSLPVEW